ncbi:hypothetical protein [Microbacterium sp. 18062]|uniref:hypothetical protein n=1 Tax=Microbacterium sp. 18062 TaxID=2681410 RepID=UPI001F2EAAE7|nr:hypothetical protein [Microbacterium sp. 18062]
MIDTTVTPTASDGSATRRALPPLAAALLAIAGNVLVLTILFAAVATVLVAGIVVFAPVLAGV